MWGLGVRVFHWTLAPAVALLLLTGFLAPRTWLRVHLIVGAIVAALLYFRVVWGVLGGRHARFGSFAPTPSQCVHHLRGVIAGRPERHLGHNPLGALMVIGFLVVLSAIVASGVVALGGVVKQGPLAAFMGYAGGVQALTIHYVLAIVVAVMIALHLGGVAMESVLTGENLTRAMITGHKPAMSTYHFYIAPARLLAGVIVGGGIAAAAVGIDALAQLPARGVPPATLDPTWSEQCGACHFAYPPSLAPASVWNAIFADLKHHYGGADASLSPALVTQLRAYADANAAGHWDTLAAHEFRVRDPADPGRITATPYWRTMHAGIADKVFAKNAVGSKGACDACHQDAATGRFAPQKIAIP
ncbi:MAG TPA: cytochrome b/b6 domain-containing protein [Acetobacteraceae bacterium]